VPTNLELHGCSGLRSLVTSSKVASTDGSSFSPPKASRPSSQKTATIPPPPIPPPNPATYWQRPSKRPAPGRRSHGTSSARKKKEKQASAETSAENSPPPAPTPAPVTKTSTALVLAKTPRRGAEEAEDRGHQEPDEALLIEFNRASPPSPTGSRGDLLSVHAPTPPDFALSRSIVRRSRRRAISSPPLPQPHLPTKPFPVHEVPEPRKEPLELPTRITVKGTSVAKPLC